MPQPYRHKQGASENGRLMGRCNYQNPFQRVFHTPDNLFLCARSPAAVLVDLSTKLKSVSLLQIRPLNRENVPLLSVLTQRSSIISNS
jgi:hypothetical protein